MRKTDCIILIFICSFSTVSFAFGFNAKPISNANGFPAIKASTFITYSFSAGRNLNHELRVEHFVHQRWSLLYTAGFASSYNNSSFAATDYHSELRAPIGITLGVAIGAVAIGGYCYSYGNGDGLGELFILSCMVPDGVAFHIPFGEKFDISPYIIATGITYQWDANNEGHFVYSPMAGVRLLYPISDIFIVSAEQNFRRIDGGNISAALGVAMSIHF